MTGREPSIYLVGFMRSGKTTVGRLLAAELALPFVDLDEEIERDASASITDIWRRHGEHGFREFETNALLAVAGDRAVFATGGGIVEMEANRSTLSRTGVCLWLRTSFEVLWERGMDDLAEDRPLWRDERQLRALFEHRQPLYSFADLILDTDGRTPTDLARRAATFARPGEVMA